MTDWRVDFTTPGWVRPTPRAVVFGLHEARRLIEEAPGFEPRFPVPPHPDHADARGLIW